MIRKIIILPQDLYPEYVTNINNINFTRREIDILACLLSARGTSKIATFLSISPKTVVNHIRNIMLKAECNSREGIIDFIEKSNKVSILRQHYSHLLVQSAFEKSLKEVSKLTQVDKPKCTIVCSTEVNITVLLGHLELAGISVQTPEQAKFDHLKEFAIYLEADESRVKELEASEHPGIILLPQVKKEESKEISQEYENDYYFTIFEILQKILPNTNLQKITSHFKDQYEQVLHSIGNIPFQNSYEERKEGEKKYNSLFKNGYLYAFMICVSIILIGYLYIFKNSISTHSFGTFQRTQLIRSDLILPSETTLVHRPELVSKISEMLKKQKDIQTVAIVGIGGAGKTTLSRQYAKQFNGNVIWEINAETKETLLRSFENLGSALAKSEEDQKTFKGLQNIKDAEERQEKVIQFVKDGLRLHSNWFLIFDNVESFIDIQKYFPHDEAQWGSGKVLVTTRNSSIQNNSPLNSLIQIGELNPQQKSNLFIQIMHQDGSSPAAKINKKEIQQFLTEIPSFPLDVSVAAYYIKETNIPYRKYLDILKENEKELSGLQENILKESGNYNKTRYKIISLPLQNLMKVHPEFPSLLIFIGLLDSQNIPKELLNIYKDNLIVDSFILNLKKYSLVSDASPSSPSDPIINIHRSTQKIILDYLTHTLSPERKEKIINSLATQLEKYTSERIDEENISKMKLLINHCERCLGHNDLIKGKNWVLVGKELGWIYFYLGNFSKAIERLEKCRDIINTNSSFQDQSIVTSIKHYLGVVYAETNEYEKARALLSDSLQSYKKYKGNNDKLVASNLQHLGVIDLYTGKYESAKQLFEQAHQILTLYYPDDNIDIGRVLVRLGNVNRELGNYIESLKILEQALVLYKQHLQEDHYRIGQTLVRLGFVYRDIGHYEKAKKLIKEGLSIYRKHFPQKSDKVAWVLGKLAQVENELGNTNEAYDLLMQSSSIYKTYFPKDFELSWVMLYLGNVFMNLGDFQKAKISLRESLFGLNNHYGQDHIETADTIRYIGKVYSLQGDLIKGEELIRKSLKMYQKTNHPQAYGNFEYLAELYLKKSLQTDNEKSAQNLRTEALSFLNQALEIVVKYFPKDSPHVKRLKAKIESIR